MDGFFFGRLDYQDKMARLFHKEMEMVWFGSDSLGMKITSFACVLRTDWNDTPFTDFKSLFPQVTRQP